jgi:hypothetical protein
VELAILLPLYAVVILASLYFGYGWLIHQEGNESNLYAAHAEGDQSMDLQDHFYRFYEGQPSLTEEDWQGDIFSANNPTSGNDEFDFHDILQELSYTFWGGFHVVGGDLVWKTEGGLNRTGKYIEDHNIMGDEELDSMAWMLNDWVSRTKAETEYEYSPWFLGGMNAEVGPTSGKVDETQFEPLKIETLVDTMRRGSEQRPLVSGQQGVSSNVYELIMRFHDAEIMPGAPSFGGTRDWWDQKTRPDLGN